MPSAVEVLSAHPERLSTMVTSILTGLVSEGTKLKSNELVVTAAPGAGKSLIKKE